MTQDHEEHLGYLLERVLVQMDEKYRKGQIEHGGRLWAKNPLGITRESVMEAIDQFVYLETFSKQFEDFLHMVVEHPLKAREQAKEWLEERDGQV